MVKSQQKLEAAALNLHKTTLQEKHWRSGKHQILHQKFRMDKKSSNVFDNSDIQWLCMSFRCLVESLSILSWSIGWCGGTVFKKKGGEPSANLTLSVTGWQEFDPNSGICRFKTIDSHALTTRSAKNHHFSWVILSWNREFHQGSSVANLFGNFGSIHASFTKSVYMF